MRRLLPLCLLLAAAGDLPTRLWQVPGDDWASVAAGVDTTCAIKRDRSLHCWGANGAGQLGLGDALDRSYPVSLGGEWASVSRGSTHTCGVTAAGDLRCFGGAEKLPARREVSAVATTEDETCVIERDRLECLGDEELPFPNVRYVAVDALAAHGCALTVDGAAFCFGGEPADPFGRLDGRPARIGVDELASVSAGATAGAGIRRDGTLWLWGRLGRLPAQPPAKVGADSDWSQVSVGGSHACALKRGGTLHCWGANDAGQLGLSGGDRAEPTQVVEDRDWVQVSAGASHTCALKSDGTLWCFGANGAGQLGSGDHASVETAARAGGCGGSGSAGGVGHTGGSTGGSGHTSSGHHHHHHHHHH